MSDVYRMCPDCSESMALDTRHCPACGYDTQAGLPMPSPSLPTTIGKAALPVLVGAASFAIRAGWKLLQNRLDVATTSNTSTVANAPERNVQPAPPNNVERRRRTVRIRSMWAVGDANGVWRRGESNHTIEFDD